MVVRTKYNVEMDEVFFFMKPFFIKMDFVKLITFRIFYLNEICEIIYVINWINRYYLVIKVNESFVSFIIIFLIIYF